MAEEILINDSFRETRVAVVENGILQDIYIERAHNLGLVGNIYMGRVARVLPGMQAAFIDIGFARAAFLHLSDLVGFDSSLMTDIAENEPFSAKREPALLETKTEQCITEFLTEGQSIAVQVIKDPLGSKGARLTTRISLAARFLVFMPELDHIGLSLRIEDEKERERLRVVVERGVDLKKGGFIVRTAAEGIADAEIEENKSYLQKLWSSVSEKIKRAKPGDTIHEELPLALRIIRDAVSVTTERVRVDTHELYLKAVAFTKAFVPDVTSRLEFYEGERPIFDIYGIEDEIQKALERKVQLKSGGHLVFDQTEAMTTIDVNTGAFVGNRNLEETIFKTNLEAAHAIGRQLRLRNLGGIIIIDFIDMNDEGHKEQVMQALEKALSKDRAKNSISSVSSLGLVEMTRKRTRESLERTFCEACPMCEGRGAIKTTETMCNHILREMLRTAKTYQAQKYLVLASQAVVDRMLDEASASVAELSDQIGRPIIFQVESLYTQEQFDVVLM